MFKICEIILLSFLVSASTNASTTQTILEVRSYTPVSQVKDLYLSDIVNMKDLPANVNARVRKIKLGNGPKLGERRVFSSRVLSSLLRKEVKELEKSDSIHFKIPSQVVIENRGYEMNQKKIESQLKKSWSTMCDNCRFEIKQLSLPRVEGQFKGRPWSLGVSGQLPKGQFSYPLTIQAENESSQTLWIQGILHVHREVPVTTRAIRFGERLQEVDIRTEWRDVTFSYDSSPKLKEAIGRKLQRNLNAGDIVWTNSLEKERAARRGQVVKVVIEEDAWRLTLSAVAQEDGQLGDVITVRNPQSNKLLSGTLTEVGEVRVQ